MMTLVLSVAVSIFVMPPHEPQARQTAFQNFNGQSQRDRNKMLKEIEFSGG
jgi:hypothetical protein